MITMLPFGARVLGRVMDDVPVDERPSGDRRMEVLGWQRGERHHRGDGPRRDDDSGDPEVRQGAPVYGCRVAACQPPLSPRQHRMGGGLTLTERA